MKKIQITKRIINTLLFGVIIFITTSCQQKHPKGIEHVVIIGIDGMSVQGLLEAHTPYMDSLLQNGAYSYKVRGIIPTVSLPNWSAMVCGAGPEITGVTDNGWKRSIDEYPPVAIKASTPKSIEIGSCNDWEGVEPHYKHYRGNTIHRTHRGYFDRMYINNTGRNDLVSAKVARDNHFLYFYVETAEKITPKSDRNWMLLFIDADNDSSTGWNGYDYVINRIEPGRRTIIEKNQNGWWSWDKKGEVLYAINENKLEIKVPRTFSGMEGKPVKFQFKWSDNMQDEGNIMDFSVNGDVMPSGRFNYLYEE